MILYLLQSPEEGIQTTLHIVLNKQIEKDAGKYFAECKPRKRPAKAEDPFFTKKIWEASEKFVKLNSIEKIKQKV